jgi:hypothetical protein
MLWSGHRVYLRCFANWPQPGGFSPLFVALVSHCNVRIDSRTRVQLPPGFMVDFGYVAAEILRSQGATHPTTGPLISWVLRGFNREREWRRGASI